MNSSINFKFIQIDIDNDELEFEMAAFAIGDRILLSTGETGNFDTPAGYPDNNLQALLAFAQAAAEAAGQPLFTAYLDESDLAAYFGPDDTLSIADRGFDLDILLKIAEDSGFSISGSQIENDFPYDQLIEAEIAGDVFDPYEPSFAGTSSPPEALNKALAYAQGSKEVLEMAIWTTADIRNGLRSNGYEVSDAAIAFVGRKLRQLIGEGQEFARLMLDQILNSPEAFNDLQFA